MEKKTAIVTGASSGIGEAIVKTLGDAGWNVVALTSDNCNLADLEATAALADRLRDEYIKVDALIHVAAFWHDDQEAFANRDLEDYDPALVAATMNVGVTSFMMLAAKLLPVIAKDGLVIGISGIFPHGASGWLPYVTSKRALEDFLVGLAQDYPTGPRIFGISPGHTATTSFKQFFPQEAAKAQPPNSISLLIEHIITGESHYVSGDIIVVKDKKAAKGYHV
jgi:3-oxoacyl-[acyl-carrier protein] reductase